MGFFQSAAFAGSVKSIEVKGNERIQESTIRAYVPLQAGQSFTQADLDRALKELYETGLFSDVKIKDDQGAIRVVVAENPILNEVVFEGNEELSDDIIKQEITLKSRDVVTADKVKQDVDRLTKLYQRKGFYGAKIEADYVKKDQNRVDLVLTFNEGKKTTIRRINFVGNRFFSQDTLRSVITSRESAWYQFLSSTDIYDPDLVTYDEQQLTQHYRNNGFMDFRVTSVDAELSKDMKSFSLTFFVEEGVRYQVGNIDFKNAFKDISPEDLKPHVTFESGDYFSQKKIDATESALVDFLGERGYAFVDIEPLYTPRDINKETNEGIVDVTFNIKEGRRVYIEQINIVGNVRTLDKVVRRELAIAEGDPYNAVKIRESEKNIRNLGFFKTVKFDVKEGSTPDQSIINIEIVEQPTGELSLGAGFSSTESLLADIRLRERNFLGRGQDVRASTSLSGKRQQVDLGISDPYFLDRKLYGGLDFQKLVRDFQDESSYDEDRLGGRATLGFDLGPDFTQRVFYYANNVKISNVDENASRFIKDQEGTFLTSGVGTRFTYDKRDNRIEPSEGYVTYYEANFAGVGGDVDYLRNEVGGTKYWPIYEKDWVLSTEGDTGYVFDYSGGDVRINDRFFLGGARLRGFELAGVGPRDRSPQEDALGGQFYARTSAELRFPLGLPEELGLSGLTFVDAGVLSDPVDEGPDVQDDNSIRASGGLGLAWRSPFGPVSVDYAIPFAKEDYDQEDRFRFSFGTQF
jgi:outer membrane protein insertion porin family